MTGRASGLQKYRISNPQRFFFATLVGIQLNQVGRRFGLMTLLVQTG